MNKPYLGNCNFDGCRTERMLRHLTCEEHTPDTASDGRLMTTDQFLATLLERCSDHFKLREALTCWAEGDWPGALEYLN